MILVRDHWPPHLALAGLVGVVLLFGAGAAQASSEGMSFQEVSKEWGVQFRHHHGGSGKRYMLETMAGGVVIFDFDGDGDEDLFYVDGGSLPGYDGEPAVSRLFRNDGAGRFIDFTEASGIRLAGYGVGGTAGDFDNDGNVDLYVTVFGANQLFRNRGDGTFSDVTSEARVGDDRWNASAAFSDVDRDGDLDLYVAGYTDFTVATHKECRTGDLVGYCQPEAYHAIADRFYRNLGDGVFEDASSSAGISKLSPAAGLGVVFGDVNEDRWPDLYVANDQYPNLLFQNQGDGTFGEVSLLAGVAYSDSGNAEAGMGVDMGDVDGDGNLDIMVTNFELETNALYRNLGSALFVDSRWVSDIAEPSYLFLAFGVDLADFDQDGDLDMVVANGHINDTAPELLDRSQYEQQNQIFENDGTGHFRVVDAGLDVIQVSRGLASGDLDGDGDLDLVVLNSNHLSEVYENQGGANRHWLLVDLEGGESNRQGIDSWLELKSAQSRQVRYARTASSYLSQSARSIHFGLGQTVEVTALEIDWPSGHRQRWQQIPVDRRLRIWE
jgi:hypothetical protein